MTDEIRSDLVYEKAAFLKKKIVESCHRCDGAGFRYTLSNGELKSYPCRCMREFVYKFDFLIAGVDEKAADKIINTREKETKVVELDITTKRETGEKFKPLPNGRGLLFRDYLNNYMLHPDMVVHFGWSYLFTGMNSTGKTFAALKVLHNYLRKNYSGHYILFRELMKQINKWLAGDKGVRKEAEALVKEIFDVDFLVIDELGKEGGGRDHVSSELESMLKERDQQSKPTILISNHTCEELIDRYTSNFSDFTSVFMKSYRVLLFNPNIDFRKIARKKWDI